MYPVENREMFSATKKVSLLDLFILITMISIILGAFVLNPETLIIVALAYSFSPFLYSWSSSSCRLVFWCVAYVVIGHYFLVLIANSLLVSPKAEASLNHPFFVFGQLGLTIGLATVLWLAWVGEKKGQRLS